jgi:hypothetical protein
MAYEEVVGIWNEFKRGGGGGCFDDRSKKVDGRELVVVSAEEELGKGTRGQKWIGIVAACRLSGEA